MNPLDGTEFLGELAKKPLGGEIGGG